MKKYLIIVASGLLWASTAALADPPPWSGQGNQQNQDQRSSRGDQDKHDQREYADQRDSRNGPQDRNSRYDSHSRYDRNGRYDSHSRYDRRDRYDRNDRYQYDRSRYVRDQRGIRDSRGHYYIVHDRGRHEGWYRRGGYLPVQYRQTRYYVTDWRARRLRAPPRGYHWVRSDNGDFLMVAIATGIIASIFASN